MLKQIVALIAIACAAAVHFHYCEWDFSSDLHSVPSEQYQRAIFFKHRSTGNNVFLLAKSYSQKEEATKYGVLLPAIMIGISLASAKLP